MFECDAMESVDTGVRSEAEVSTSVVCALRVMRAWVASSEMVTLCFVCEGEGDGSEAGAGNSLVLCQSKTHLLRDGVQAVSESD